MLPRHPARRGHQAVVLGHRLGVVPVEVGDVNLAVRAALAFEGDLGLRDAFAAQRLDEVIRERMGLPPQRRAGVGLGNQRALVVRISGLGLRLPLLLPLMRYCAASAFVNAKPWT